VHAASATTPATPTSDVVDTYHGTQIHDPYRWLEDTGAPAVQQWIDAQNAHTDEVMTGFADAGAIIARVGALALTSTQRQDPQLAGGVLFYLRQTPPQPQAVLVAQRWPDGEAKVLVDPNATDGATAVSEYWPSPDGRRVAYGTAEGGTENTTIHFVDVADARVAEDALWYAGGGTTPQALAWDADGAGVTYVRLPLPDSGPTGELQFNAQLYHHTLGTPSSADTEALGRGFSRIAEYLLISSAHGHAAAFVYYGDATREAVYVRKRHAWHQVLGREAEVRAADSPGNGAAWDGERLLVVSYQDAPRGKLLSIDGDGHAQVLVPQQDWAMNGVAPIRNGFLLREVSGPDWRLRQFSTDGRPVRTLPLPPTGVGIGKMASDSDSPVALISYEGWSLPMRWAKYDADSGTLTTVFEVKPAADYSRLRTGRLNVKSADGTPIPVTVVALDSVQPDGHRPMILTGYGGYGLSQAPRFIGTTLAWLERGGVYALANIRGGGEYGDAWHEAGARANKQNSFDDFHAAARALVGARWTDVAHLGILGSNGGLLMGAALTQYPGDYRAVVSVVGVYDMLRAELWPNGAYNTGEYGTVQSATEFAWLRAYSPLLRVQPGTAYPAVLVITAENDPRVAPWHSRKFAAALQRANTSPWPILLLTRRNEGHGVTSSFSQRVGNAGATLAFFAHELDLPKAAPAGGAAAVEAASTRAPGPSSPWYAAPRDRGVRPRRG
jgi:prolyl oligopeptidase